VRGILYFDRCLRAINRDLQNPANTVTVRADDGTEQTVPTAERFRSVVQSAMALLRTDEFVRIEQAIKRNVLEQLGLDQQMDQAKLDLYFTPLDTLD
jgi:hypothetical protein